MGGADPHHSTPLIDAAALASRLLALPGDDLSGAATGLVLLDARPAATARERGDYLRGAREADLDRHLSAETADPADGGRHPLPSRQAWARQLGDWGITPTTDVVVYDDAGGAMAAARCWWMLRAAGHRRAWVLDGGLPAALAAGIPTRPTASPPPRSSPPYPVDDWSDTLIGWRELQHLDSRGEAPPRLRLLDARSAQRFRGEGDPFDPVTGHIPGSRNAPFAEALRSDGTFRSPDELRQWLTAALGGPGEATGGVAVSCGSGVTACHLALAMEIAGLPAPRLYVGSWSEWCRRDLPVATGEASAL
ncbi:MAG: sulfurtransferase [Acidobacteria bacterium]|nr:MAG: sulfurtransferase [Acidobacteriota bacterium]REK04583.1 MAG: sulfurtransferase [Acidobacteriota bacterium]